MDLADFLLARIAEDEAVARAATTGPWTHDPSKEWHTDPVMLARARAGRWTPEAEEFVGAGPNGEERVCVASTGPADDRQSMADAAHIARWDPARVLAECEAKRRIVAEHADINADWTPLFGDAPEDRPPSRCQTCTSGADPGYLSPFPCPTLRLLALPYADHPDYDESWLP